MSSEKAELSRAGTMQVTAKDGKAFLDKNLTDWKKPYLMDQSDEEEEAEQAEATAPKGKKGKMAKHSTMKGTAKEANAMLDEAGRPDEDALTRGQQKKIEEINTEKPAPAKKAKMSKATTMVNTAKEGKNLLGGEKLSDTRGETKKRKGAPKRASTIAKTMAEAKAVFGDLPSGEGRSLRKRPAPVEKPALKKKGTMQKTAKEGKEFLKKQNKGAKKAKKEENNDVEKNVANDTASD